MKVLAKGMSCDCLEIRRSNPAVLYLIFPRPRFDNLSPDHPPVPRSPSRPQPVPRSPSPDHPPDHLPPPRPQPVPRSPHPPITSPRSPPRAGCGHCSTQASCEVARWRGRARLRFGCEFLLLSKPVSVVHDSGLSRSRPVHYQIESMKTDVTARLARVRRCSLSRTHFVGEHRPTEASCRGDGVFLDRVLVVDIAPRRQAARWRGGGAGRDCVCGAGRDCVCGAGRDCVLVVNFYCFPNRCLSSTIRACPDRDLFTTRSNR